MMRLLRRLLGLQPRPDVQVQLVVLEGPAQDIYTVTLFGICYRNFVGEIFFTYKEAKQIAKQIRRGSGDQYSQAVASWTFGNYSESPGRYILYLNWTSHAGRGYKLPVLNFLLRLKADGYSVTRQISGSADEVSSLNLRSPLRPQLNELATKEEIRLGDVMRGRPAPF